MPTPIAISRSRGGRTARTAFAALALLAAACAPARQVPPALPAATVAPAPAGVLVPIADHHKHLLSPATAALGSIEPLETVPVPAAVAELLRMREARWDDSLGLAELFTDDAIVLSRDGPTWEQGRRRVARYLSQLFAREHRITPVAYREDGPTAYLAGYLTRDLETGMRHFGHVLMTLRREGGAWRIAAESPTFLGVTTMAPVPADTLIAELDAAGIRKAAVLSVAYWFGSPLRDAPVADEYAKVRAENDWVAAQAGLYPDRLVAFCSFNPLREYALAELARCATLPHVKGIKLHFGNSGVKVGDSAQVEQLRRVFRAANDAGLAIVAHLWVLSTYGRAEAQVFLDSILPAAPDVVVQVAHFAGGGPGYTDPALEVLADAVAAGDPRTRNLYFDIATVADQQPDEALRTFAERIRQVGVGRVLWGSDLGPPNPMARESWLTFRSTVPLTDEEFRAIAENVAPYLR